MPKFSVVISVFNKEKYIANTIQSVLNQTLQEFEIVILNDGSTDNSEAEILQFKDSRIRYFSEANQGAGAARNFVIEKAKYNYIALLDADDLWLPFYLEEQERLIEKYPKQSVFATASAIKKRDEIFHRSYSINFENQKDGAFDYFEASFKDSILQSSTTVLKKEIFDIVGYYDPNIKSGQDTDLYIRIGVKFKVIFSSKICVYYKYIENSLFRSSKKITDKLNLDSYTALEKNNKALKKFIDLNRYSLCIFAKRIGDKNAFQDNLKKIDQSSLSKLQRFILKQNPKTIEILLKLQSVMAKNGFSIGTFK
ncbi:glycosyltransferase family 2 protein [uncultured Marixanthomonas sp.]|uniref:glycosyltransferase family 2 protein n=1 Tax=uncultured Marixanthomonas sp. TaxID=757245 RepID=UPI0030D83885|tara:strand:+ start:33108 stop:34037 length:930 start_codon:yes stop_codon:yes gene_type:complete